MAIRELGGETGATRAVMGCGRLVRHGAQDRTADRKHEEQNIDPNAMVARQLRERIENRNQQIYQSASG